MRHAAHIGEWIVIDGVRTSYRGKLLRVEEHGGEAILALWPAYALEALADTNNEVAMEGSEEAPWEVYSQACLAVGRQPKGWPKR